MIKTKVNGSCDLFFPRLENRELTIFKGWPDRKAICAQRVLYLGMIHMKNCIGVKCRERSQ